MINQIWFSKYCILKPLGHGGSADVYLAEHIKLKTLRVIKRISKDNLLHEQLLKEAYILKNLKHPCIPIIYDFEEDAHNSYIIEQYIEGLSLKDYRQQNPLLSEEIILHFAVQICDLLQYLYSFDNPVLYLDLKPENIIISDNSVKLIDFGASSYKSNLDDRKYSLGSKGYAAPELYSGQNPDERTDIYGIGALLYFMATGSPYPLSSIRWKKEKSLQQYSKKLKAIIGKCLRHHSGYRYPTITILKNELLASNRKKNSTTSKKSISIAVAGTEHRIGVTHLALLITSYINETGNKGLYLEYNESGHISSILKRYQNIKTNNGIYQLYHCNLIPNSNNFTYNKEDYPITILDYGCLNNDNLGEFLKAERKFVIAGAKEWELNDTEHILRLLSGCKDISYLFNFIDGSQFNNIVKHMGKLTCHRIPYVPNPYECKKNELLEDFLKNLIYG